MQTTDASTPASLLSSMDPRLMAEIAAKQIELAKGGDTAAARFVWELLTTPLDCDPSAELAVTLRSVVSEHMRFIPAD